MNPVLFTLCEGDYHFGVAALFNSAHRRGFKGKYVVGYRGAMPPWAVQLRSPDGGFKLGESEVHFIELNPPMHFGYFKPFFALELASRFPSYTSLIYADPDVVFLARWQFFENWFDSNPSIGICADQNFVNLSGNHPWRREWLKLIERAGLSVVVCGAPYANGGFVACHRQHEQFWGKLSRITERYSADGNSLMGYQMENRACPVVSDQDLLACALMCTEVSALSPLGHEGMGFNGDFKFLCHVVEQPKPWRRGHVRLALKGIGQSTALTVWRRNRLGPIQSTRLLIRIIEIGDFLIAKVISRFYKR